MCWRVPDSRIFQERFKYGKFAIIDDSWHPWKREFRLVKSCMRIQTCQDLWFVEPQFEHFIPSTSRSVPFSSANSRSCIFRRSLFPSGFSIPDFRIDFIYKKNAILYDKSRRILLTWADSQAHIIYVPCLLHVSLLALVSAVAEQCAVG